jgi:hypothetical protein
LLYELFRLQVFGSVFQIFFIGWGKYSNISWLICVDIITRFG